MPYQRKSVHEDIQVDPSQEVGQKLGQVSGHDPIDDKESKALLSDIIDELKSTTPVITKKKPTKLKIVRKSSSGSDRKKSIGNKTPPSEKDFRKLEAEFKNLSPFKTKTGDT